MQRYHATRYWEIDVVRGSARQHPFAWLAMLAMGLLLIAPDVSRLLPAAPMPMEIAAPHPGHADGGQPDKHAGHGVDACGYCTLMAHGAVGSGTVAFTVPAIPAAAMAVRPAGRHIANLIIWRKHARGPPAQAACARVVV